MYNNNNSFGNASQGYQSSQGFQGNNAQYQGFQKQYQPIGAVQSFYNQSNAGQANQGFNQGFNQGNSQVAQATSQESFHTANYRGNQPGHDAYKRSDSSMPAQQQQSGFQSGYSSYIPVNNQYASNQSQQFGYASAQQPFVSSQFVSSAQSNQQPYGQAYVSPNAFHTANYRGNQPGHDAYLRGESSTPSQQSFQSSYGSQQSMQQNNPQQSLQSFNPGFNNPGMGQQFGSNSSF
ncbi:hypothetical protein QFZ77_005333 [Paenibacillus sp. V4I3]|uniref:hypothetical protein n=1 Tax=Paenibacillus sp. V4I3 TaxID=3042305 RepID=UPI0027839AF2|nr:hypothetical protein [Paenibacillus sp. V4I3]MDQ0876674.1 hypothetical protein [Paenibacillus sp. V4I3]